MKGRLLRALGTSAVLLMVVASVVPGVSQSASMAATAPPEGFSKTVTVTRTNLVNGKDDVVDTRTFSVTVDRTTGLRDRDGLAVSWSGAHPTGGIIGDVNSGAAVEEEYPVVILQCRGVDSATVPLAQQLRPETCFTQSPNERFVQNANTMYPPWRLDRYAPLGERGVTTNVPSPAPVTCPHVDPEVSQRYVPFATASGTSFPGGSNGCAGTPPEMSSLSTLGLPSNSTYGITSLDGRGAARFDVRTAEDNASLGCSPAVPCSMVVIPIMGISCDLGASQLPAADRPTDPDDEAYSNGKCLGAGHFRPGEFNTSPLQEDISVAGALWWSGSNWRQRVTVPLSFAPGASACDLSSSGNPIYFYGSELLTQATAQWAPKFCLDKSAFPFRHVQTGEPQARNLLASNSVQAALTSRLPVDGYSTPTVTAPVAVSGFAIAYTVDDKDRNPVAQLRLTPRLLAKLLSQSYPMIPAIQREYAALNHNPINISTDPEFQALNPTVQHGVPASEAASTLLALSSDSDVMHALTSYLQADPDARAFLDGTPDPWGMVVNPNYKGIALPVENWPLLDGFVTKIALNPCLEHDPLPYFGLAAAPTQRLATIALDMQYALSPSQVVCQLSPLGAAGDKLVALGRQGGGFHFMLGVTSLADAKRFGISTAALLSSTSSTAETKFSNDVGRTFQAPNDASLRAATALLAESPTTKTWSLDAAMLLSRGAAAYPGTMLVYASVPTHGLPSKVAKEYQTWLEFAAGAGQVRGSALGELPAGYLPLTAANGLAAQVAYTRRAALSVGAQDGTVPGLHDVGPVTPPRSSTPTPSTPAVSAVPSSTAAGSHTGPALPSIGPVAAPSGPATVPGPLFPTPGPTPQPVVAASGGSTLGAALGLSSSVLPILLVVGLLSGAVAFGAVGRDGLRLMRRPPS